MGTAIVGDPDLDARVAAWRAAEADYQRVSRDSPGGIPAARRVMAEASRRLNEIAGEHAALLFRRGKDVEARAVLRKQTCTACGQRRPGLEAGVCVGCRSSKDWQDVAPGRAPEEKPRGKPGPKPKISDAELARRLSGGESVASIAASTNVSTSAVCQRAAKLRAAGLVTARAPAPATVPATANGNGAHTVARHVEVPPMPADRARLRALEERCASLERRLAALEDGP